MRGCRSLSHPHFSVPSVTPTLSYVLVEYRRAEVIDVLIIESYIYCSRFSNDKTLPFTVFVYQDLPRTNVSLILHSSSSSSAQTQASPKVRHKTLPPILAIQSLPATLFKSSVHLAGERPILHSNQLNVWCSNIIKSIVYF